MLSPPEAASALLETHKGHQRDAETEAWKNREEFGNPEHDGFKYWTQVAVHIAFGTEYPRIERRASERG